MEEKKAESKLTYEQLEQAAHQLSEQNRQLYNKLQEMNMVNMFKRMDYLFKVIEYGSKFDKDFLNTCIEEIKELMKLPEEDSKNEE